MTDYLDIARAAAARRTKGATKETKATKDCLRSHMSLSSQSAPLPPLLERACRGIPLEPDELVRSLSASDITAILGGRASEGVLRAYAEALAERKLRERGVAPPHYTAMTVCRSGCGPVPIFEGAPAEVLGCPWCWNRLRGLPMPGGGQRSGG